MRSPVWNAVILPLTVIVFLSSCSNGQPYVLPEEQSAAYVIGKEGCHSDSAYDSWLLDFTVHPGTKQYGDTITFQGKVYANVVKAMGLAPPFDQPGKKVELRFYLDPARSQSSSCDLDSAAPYLLRHLVISDQHE